ncbi:acyltransferase family protein [Polynucleobacter sp. MWH-UH35A]|uniref:acyltransferase family protein n=1 Tax=Polynucleobacter sp. MWH-UH35A TaxID=1855619 RepID=UPI001BFE9E0F|nr:acyltransferase family protein [Polynucleobacter sp. MWH-UH35A]QWD59899.1 acyltransferase [Polynucleobacter sp. MWH-UH35A]
MKIAKQSHPKYRSDIDGLRAIAILSVMAFHGFPNLVPGGFIGVDIFFVISGYLISWIIFENLQEDNFSFINFYAHRIRRIFPSLLVLFLIVFLVGYFSLSTEEFSQLGRHIAGGAGFISNFILLNESGYFDIAAEAKPLLNLWSLGIEEQFYILWPLVAWIGLKLRLRFLLLVIALGIFSFGLNIFYVSSSPTYTFYFPATRFWELLIGSLIAGFAIKGNFLKKDWINLFSFAGFFMLLAGQFLIGVKSAFPGWWALLPTVGTALLIISGPTGFVNKNILTSKILVWIGLISFPLYLWHWPILVFFGLLCPSERTGLETLYLITLSFFLAWVSYRFVEKPIRGSGGSKTTIALICLMFVMGFVGYNTYVRDGLPFREAAKNTITLNQLMPNPNVPNCSVGEPAYPISQQPKECFANTKDGSWGTSVFLWGDSHVANFSYGMTADRIQKFDIQLRYLMKGGCPPVLNFSPSGNSECFKFNEFALDQIAKYRPSTVVLLADWVIYRKVGQNYLSNEMIVTTIDSLKSLGVKKVILVGNFPDFEVNQGRLGMNIFIPNLVSRTFKRLNFSSIQADKDIKEIAEKNDVYFVSPIGVLCNSEGCLISASESEFIPMAYDKTHLTYPGSDYFIRDSLGKNFFR